MVTRVGGLCIYVCVSCLCMVFVWKGGVTPCTRVLYSIGLVFNGMQYLITRWGAFVAVCLLGVCCAHLLGMLVRHAGGGGRPPALLV